MILLGKIHKQVYIGVKGIVYDVSISENFKPDQGYGKLWAGKDATYALSKMSLKPEDAGKMDWNGLNDMEYLSLASWEAHFTKKYEKVGTVKGVQAGLKMLDAGIKVAQEKKDKEDKEKEAKAAADKNVQFFPENSIAHSPDFFIGSNQQLTKNTSHNRTQSIEHAPRSISVEYTGPNQTLESAGASIDNQPSKIIDCDASDSGDATELEA